MLTTPNSRMNGKTLKNFEIHPYMKICNAGAFVIGKLFLVTFLVILSGCGNSASDRAIEFTKNVFQGKTLQPEEWLTVEARRSESFDQFGGLSALMRQSKLEAERKGGVATVRVINTEVTVDKTIVEVEVTFRNGEKTSSRDIWKQEDGTWKMAP